MILSTNMKLIHTLPATHYQKTIIYLAYGYTKLNHFNRILKVSEYGIPVRYSSSINVLKHNVFEYGSTSILR
jgi:hypothetical protein